MKPVIVSGTNAEIARQVLNARFRLSCGIYSLFRCEEDWFHYGKDSRGIRIWQRISQRNAADLISNVLIRAHEVKRRTSASGVPVTEHVPFPSTKAKGDEITYAAGLISNRKLSFEHTRIHWLGAPDDCPIASLNDAVFFDDRVIDIAAMTTSDDPHRWITCKRSPLFFAPFVVGCKFDLTATCPRYEQAQREWFGKEWQPYTNLREDFYGDLLRERRVSRRVLVEFGKSRGGKGCGPMLLGEMLGTNCGVFSIWASQLVESKHSLNHLNWHRALVVQEIGNNTTNEQRRLHTNTKVVLGDDVARDERKYQDPGTVRYNVGVIFQGNSLPRFDDEQGALVSRILPLHYRFSYLGKEDDTLKEVLLHELPAIAIRWTKALIQMELRARAHEPRWQLPPHSLSLLARLRALNNPIDAFLNAHFRAKPTHWTADISIIRERDFFEQNTGFKLRHPNGKRISDAALVRIIEERTSWSGIQRATRTELPGLLGLVRRKQPDYIGFNESLNLIVGPSSGAPKLAK